MLWFLNVVWGCLIPQSRGWGLGRVQSVVVNCDSSDVCHDDTFVAATGSAAQLLLTARQMSFRTQIALKL